MSTVSPPKPWEIAGAAALAAPVESVPSSAMTAPLNSASTSHTTSDSATPPLPDRPNTLNAVVNQTASNYSPYGQSRLGAGIGTGMSTGIGTSPYSSYGGGAYSSYSSPYSRFGGMGGMSSMYGGGYGGGMYGGGGYGGGMYGGGGYGGMPGQGQDPNSLTQSFNQSTAATFQIIESIVGAFGGFAQMLDSTYMATHSSFFAMVSVAEQFGNLRNTLGSVLGIFTILRWIRTLLAKITGRPPPADATSLTPGNFASFMSGGRNTAPATLPDGSPAPPKPSKKPFIMFAVAVFGLPYLMGKLIRALARSQEAEQLKQQQQMQQQGGGMQMQFNPATGQQEQVPIDPRKLDFCRLLYDYTPASQSNGIDLAVKKGDLVAILSKTDPMGNASEWWRCRARDGKVGYLPSPYLETIQRRPVQQAITAGSAPGSRTTTLRGSDLGDRTKSLNSVSMPFGKQGPAVTGKANDITVESFQKSAFNS